jgi:hypothetical protein
MALENVKINALKGTIKYSSRTYVYISASRKIKLDSSSTYAGIIIEGRNVEFVRMVLRRIRGSHNPDVYLKPVFLMNGNAHKDPLVAKLIDGILNSFDQIPLIHDITEAINQRKTELTFINSISFEAQVLSKLMCYMYTRDEKELEPVPYALSSTNYSFPFLACNYEPHDEFQIFDLLQAAVNEGLFSAEYSDRVYLCANCKSSHLSYRETCTKCNSTNTDSFDIVHHFPCAYVGPMTDFTNDLDDKLNCPKCSKTLKHIGIDYDKPSVLHICKNCNHRFQDFNVRAKCMSCTHDNPVEQLVAKEIFTYTLSKKGEDVALRGYSSTPKDIEEIIGTVKFDTYKTVVKYEVERIRQTEGSSNIVAVNIVNAGQFYAKVGSNGQQAFLRDIVNEIRSSIRSSDMITFYSSEIILITMNDIPSKIVNRILNDILDLLRKLIENNFSDLALDINGKSLQLNLETTSELQINELINSL